MESARQILTESRWANLVDSRVLDLLVAVGRSFNAPEGRVLFSHGDRVPGVYALHEGLVELARTDRAGRARVLRIIEPGDTFAEAAVLGNFAAPVSAVCKQPSTLAIIDAQEFRRVVAEDHEACLAVLKAVVGRVHFLVNYLEDLMVRDATSRVAKYIVARAQTADGQKVVFGTTKGAIADHLNIRGETLSRVISKLAQDGWVARDGESLQIVDMPALVAAADCDA